MANNHQQPEVNIESALAEISEKLKAQTAMYDRFLDQLEQLNQRESEIMAKISEIISKLNAKVLD